MGSNSDKLNTPPSRRENRLAAAQFLYMWEINPSSDQEKAILNFFEIYPDRKRKEYLCSEELIRGALENLEKIEENIKRYSQNWTFIRIAKTDLVILRLAIYELLYRKAIPPLVTINEAIDLAKIFSNEDSKRFINGILDKVKGTLGRPFRSSEDNNN